MLQTIRRRLGHPIQATLALLESRWSPHLLDGLKERLLQDSRIGKVLWRWSGGRPPEPRESTRAKESQQPAANRRGGDPRPSTEARHVMQLYVVRHGIAVDSGAGDPDEWRPLTEKGRRRFQKTARAFGNLGRKLDLILTSPLVRAVQTAEILAGETDHGEVAVLAELDPKFDVEAVRKAVATRAGNAEALAIVGHEPQLSALLAALSGVPQVEIDLDKGAIVRLDVSSLTDGGIANPRWWIKPKGSRKKGLPLRKHDAEPGVEASSARSERKSKKGRRGKQKPGESLSPAESGRDGGGESTAS
ncbi:MAG TPA: phosphohistidine phosphatase SixA [Myxococcales bacterium]|nr:phosphohistidine phosphatase SixA [Myxococcales bacterium]